MLTKQTINFLTNLKQNNNRDWFLTNKAQYENAKQEMVQFVAAVLSQLSKKNKAYADLDPQKCLFRMNRDVRFSPNKAPYKTNFGANLNLFGKKSINAGLYIHIEPGSAFIGGGIYMPPSDILFKIRQEIDYNFNEFKKILNHKDFKQHYGQLDKSETLKNPPKGFDKENPAIEFLKLKHIVAFSKVTDKEILNPDFNTQVTQKLVALLPLIDFINKGLDD